jgi:hypothetical protein
MEIEFETNGILWLLAAIIAFMPVLIFFRAYLSVKSTKLLYTALAFLLIFIKAAVLAVRFIVADFSDDPWWSWIAVIEIAIIALITLSLVAKGSD